MADTPLGETATPGDSKTNEPTATTPQVNVVDPAEVERLKKEASQATMRANQLQNQIDEAKKAEEARTAKELEEKQEFKSLYEQEKAKLQEIETEREVQARKAEIETASSEVLKEFPDAVKEIAKEAGLSVLDNSEEAKASFNAKLDSIAAKLPQAQVSPNNPGTPTPNNTNLSSDQMKIALKSEQNFHEMAAKLPGVSAMLNKRQ